MSSPFAHTLRSLELDSGRGARALGLLTLILLVAWTLWLLAARVAVTEVSEEARVEAAAGGHELSLSLAGRVRAVRVAVGDAVAAGQVLVELDDRETVAALELAREQQTSIANVITRREQEIAAEREVLEAVELAAGAVASEARARVDRALAAARLAEAELAEAVQLRDSEVGTASEVRRTQSTSEQLRAQTRELRSAGDRQRLELARDSRAQLAEIVRIEGEIAELEVEQANARARIGTLEEQLEHHLLRAPIDGVVGELAAIERGSWLDRGDRVGVIIPPGDLQIVAEFSPAAIGRVAVGQPATLRLAGFPWTQFGAVRATVIRVATEPRQGMIRVELRIDQVPAAITLEHGLPGALEVEVDQASPADLLLRAAGRRLTGSGAAEVE